MNKVSCSRRLSYLTSLGNLFLHLPLNCEGRWGTIDDFATSILHLPLFSTVLWDLGTPGLSIP